MLSTFGGNAYGGKSGGTIRVIIQKSLEYAIVASQKITKGAIYTIVVSADVIEKALNYEIVTAGALQKALSYIVRIRHAEPGAILTSEHDKEIMIKSTRQNSTLFTSKRENPLL